MKRKIETKKLSNRVCEVWVDNKSVGIVITEDDGEVIELSPGVRDVSLQRVFIKQIAEI